MFANVPMASANHMTQTRFSVRVNYTRAPILRVTFIGGMKVTAYCIYYSFTCKYQILLEYCGEGGHGERTSTFRVFPRAYMVSCLSSSDSDIPTIDFASDRRY